MIADEETGKPWFVAKDVAEKLGYVDPKQAVRQHCKHGKFLRGVESTLLTGGNNNYGVNIIPQGDVYQLIVRSKLPAAQRFESWVME